jgi:CheY-like chemotaxis protein
MAVILVVDDDAMVAESIGIHVESAGHQAVFAAHGGEAMDVLERRHVDVVVTDILMPEVEGIEFVLSARRRGHNLPIIAVTGGSTRRTAGSAGFDYLKIAREMGATRTLSKPFTRRQLLEELDACLAGAGIVSPRGET